MTVAITTTIARTKEENVKSTKLGPRPKRSRGTFHRSGESRCSAQDAAAVEGWDPLAEVLAESADWLDFLTDSIAAAFLADIEAGRTALPNGTFKPWRHDLDALTQRYYDEIRSTRPGSRR